MAGIAYVEFEANEGQTVIVEITQAADNTGLGVPVLNAFEIDGTHPTLAIKKVVPEDKEGHHDPELGLSWEAGEGAVSHDLYLGTDKYSVSVADTSSTEYKGRLTETSYAFEEEMSHMLDYYWRVDEIDAEGNVIKGKVYTFQVRHLAFPTAEGYTNVEMYLNELMGDPLVWADGSETGNTPVPTATSDIKETATPDPVETATPDPIETETPDPVEIVTPDPVETATPEPTGFLAGDVNLDGVVDASDALLVLKHAAKLEILDEDACKRAELDDNENIDASDALIILKIAAKLI